MKPKERILRSINHQEIDRIPIGFNWGSQEEINALMSYLRVTNNDELLNALNVDIRWLPPLVYKGEQRYYKGEKADYWGLTEKALKDGDSSNQCPFAEVSSIDEVEMYKWPSPEDFYDVYKISDALEKYKDLRKYETILRWEDERLYVESSFNGELLSITVELTNVFEDDLMTIKRYILKQSHQHKFQTIEKSLKTLD